MIPGMELLWRTSSFSFANGNCTEVASDGSAVLVRDTKDRAGPVLRITPAAWARFTRGMKENRGSGG